MFGKKSPSNVATLPVPAATAPKPTSAPKQTSAPGKPKVSKEKVEQFNKLKMHLHRKVIDQLDLTRMVGDDETLRAQVKEVVSQLADQENTLLNFNERQRLISEVLDETPAAYKPIDDVMAAQSDLVDIVHTLRQVVCVKG